jgi:hypothetical protein
MAPWRTVTPRHVAGLPLGNGLITGTLQTSLAHVNVLALNRGIPNAYLAGLADDATIARLGRVRSKVLVATATSGKLEIIPLTDDEHAEWVAANGRSPISVPSVEHRNLAMTHTFSEILAGEAAHLDILRPVIGGKATRFVELAAPGSTTMPDRPMMITVRPFVDHLKHFDAQISVLLTDAELQQSARARLLTLEGRTRFDERHATDRDQQFADGFEVDHPAGTPLGDALAAGGIVQMLRASHIDADSLASITAAAVANFDNHAPEQGLRVRSSSVRSCAPGVRIGTRSHSRNGSASSSHTEAVRWRSWSTLDLMTPWSLRTASQRSPSGPIRTPHTRWFVILNSATQASPTRPTSTNSAQRSSTCSSSTQRLAQRSSELGCRPSQQMQRCSMTPMSSNCMSSFALWPTPGSNVTTPNFGRCSEVRYEHSTTNIA